MEKILIYSLILSLFYLNGFAEPAEPLANRELFNSTYTKYQNSIKKGKYLDALPYAKQAYELGIGLYGDNNKNIAALAYNYGNTLVETGRQKDAEPVLRKSIEIYERIDGKDAMTVIDPLMALGNASADIGNSWKQKKTLWTGAKNSGKAEGC